jgi:hypothetical protein
MPKQKQPETPVQSAYDSLSWINHLPEEGGAWGIGLIETVKSSEEDIGSMQAEIETIKVRMKARQKLIRQCQRRAEKEAPLIFTPEQISVARSRSVKLPLSE